MYNARAQARRWLAAPGVHRANDRLRRAWAIIRLALQNFLRMDGAQLAAAFAHYAFFALFPLIVILVTIASAVIDRDQATAEIIAWVQTYIPTSGDLQTYIFTTIAGVVTERGQTGLIATVMLIWAAMQFFTTLIDATNRAWGVQTYSWWRLPLQSLVFLALMAGAVCLGIMLPLLAVMVEGWFMPVPVVSYWVYALAGFFVPMVVVFLSLSLFYRLAPRQPTQFAQVWRAALGTTVLLRAAESLFVIYLTRFATLNAIYGAFGGIMALLLWIYLSGCILIFGACLCAAQATAPSPLPPPAASPSGNQSKS